MKFRHLGNYPPYTYLGSLTLLGENKEMVEENAKKIVQYLKRDDIKVLGPIELLKIMDNYRYRIVIKGKNEAFIASYLQDVYTMHKNEKYKTKLEIEMNPYMLD